MMTAPCFTWHLYDSAPSSYLIIFSHQHLSLRLRKEAKSLHSWGGRAPRPGKVGVQGRSTPFHELNLPGANRMPPTCYLHDVQTRISSYVLDRVTGWPGGTLTQHSQMPPFPRYSLLHHGPPSAPAFHPLQPKDSGCFLSPLCPPNPHPASSACQIHPRSSPSHPDAPHPTSNALG